MLVRVFMLTAPLILLCAITKAEVSQSPLNPGLEVKTPLRVAIIGAGAAGSSASYHLSIFANATASLGPDAIQVTIFDPAPRPGGRTTTVNALNNPEQPVELGASIFVKINRILYNASRDFGLEVRTAYHGKPRGSDWGLGVWDGTQFVFKQASSDDDEGGGESWRDWKGWWDIAKLLWRYGLSPIRTQRTVKDAVGRLLQFYDAPLFPFSELDDAVAYVELQDITGVTGVDVLRSAGVGLGFQREIIQASTRVNYAQNLAQIHGLEALVCMATDGAIAVRGGNWQIFDRMIEQSNAHYKANTTVTDVQRAALDKGGSYSVHSVSTDSETGAVQEAFDDFDTVILAAPYQFANVTFFPPLVHTPAEVPYVKLYVTLFTSPHRLSPSFFGLESVRDVPTMVLTTLPEGTELDDSARGVDAVGTAGFWSISTLRAIEVPPEKAEDDQSTTTQYLYKIFSPAPLTGTWLSSLLGFPYNNNSDIDPLSDLLSHGSSSTNTRSKSRDITWLQEKVWHSYPYEIPRRSGFEHTRLERAPDFGGKGVWYTAGIEGFISTMETSALMGRNVAALVLEELGWDGEGMEAGKERVKKVE